MKSFIDLALAISVPQPSKKRSNTYDAPCKGVKKIEQVKGENFSNYFTKIEFSALTCYIFDTTYGAESY